MHLLDSEKAVFFQLFNFPVQYLNSFIDLSIYLDTYTIVLFVELMNTISPSQHLQY